MSDEGAFDLNAANWRHAHMDEQTFVEALADRLSKSLPSLVRVERDHHLFSKTHHVTKIELVMGERTYILISEGGRLVTRHAKAVRGVTLSSREIPMDEWLSDLSEALNEYVKMHEDGRHALEDFLL